MRTLTNKEISSIPLPDKEIVIQINTYEFVLIYDRQTKETELRKKYFPPPGAQVRGNVYVYYDKN